MNYNIITGHITDSIAKNGNYTYTRRVSKTIPDERESSIAKLADNLYKAGSALYSSNYSSGASTNITLKLEKFIKSYNELSKNIENSGSKTAKEDFDKINKLLSENSSALEQIGVKFRNGKLESDAKKLAKITSPHKLTEAFRGSTNMLSGIIKYSMKINNTLKNKTISQEYPSYKTVELDSAQTTGATNSAAVFNSLDSLSRYNYTDGNRSSITELIKSYADNYNTLISQGSGPLIDELKNITLSHKLELENSGIIVNEDSISVDDGIIGSASMENLGSLFSGGSDYGSEINRISRQLFAGYIDATSNNITLV